MSRPILIQKCYLAQHILSPKTQHSEITIKYFEKKYEVKNMAEITEKWW